MKQKRYKLATVANLQHWRLIPLARRKAYRRLHAIWCGKDGRGMTIGEIQAHPKWGRRAIHWDAFARIWRRMSRQVVETALTIGP